MGKLKGKGSIIFEILIVILVLALVGTIMYPKSVWQKTQKDTNSCRENMDKILKAELIYLKYHNSYEDTLAKVINFIEQGDSTGALKLEYISSDTALADQILTHLTETDPEADTLIKKYLADTLLFTILEISKYDTNLATVILNRLEKTELGESVTAAREKGTDSSNVYILGELSKEVSQLDIITPLQEDDSLKLVMQRIKPEVLVSSLVDTLYKNPNCAAKVDSSIHHNFESLKFCPTNGKSYNITTDDTSTIKVLNIYCPIDSIEIEDSKNDFLNYHIGHLRLENHGNISEGEKSWIKH